jgi:calcineurin-like phosphoesterase family protein
MKQDKRKRLGSAEDSPIVIFAVSTSWKVWVWLELGTHPPSLRKVSTSMIQQVLNKRLLTDLLKQMRAQAEVAAEDRRARTETPIDDMNEGERAEIVNGLNEAEQFLKNEETAKDEQRRGGEDELTPSERSAYIPRSPELSNLQSAIEKHFFENRPELVETPDPEDDRRLGPAPVAGSNLTIWPEYLEGRRLFGAFEQTDIGWINSLFAEGVRKFKGRHAFIDRPARKEPITLPDDNLRMIVVGDWGSGIPRAQKVSTYMRRELDDPAVKEWQKHVIHLGDVYYSGWEHEYRDRFLKYWPVKPAEKEKIGSFNLNGNHDMFSGGWDYYDYCLKDERFSFWQGKSSLFHMANKNWQIFGLDTSHRDAALRGDQPSWILKGAQKGLKTMLLSHHQYCSSFETVDQSGVPRQIQPVLKELDVASWLWGHEHRLMTFNEVDKIRFPRCIGHGGVPVYQLHDADGPTPAPGKWEYRDYVDGGVELWAKFGFAVLDFHGDKIQVRYLDEDGKVLTAQNETIQ